ncbi:MAG: carboxypeptidase-like regulatory domain-containing protein [Bacteroidota bacterium]|nr:carboxypeptidase-like regulatory domain-containing protein [Bacteroidota bacterium]
MRNFLKFIGALLLMMSGIETLNNHSWMQGKDDSTGPANTLTEDDPILMHGRIRTGSGGAISGASVVLYYAGTTNTAYSATSDSNGDYTINPVAAGSYTVEIRHSSYITKTYALTITATITQTDTLLPRP